jgi:hypothetical protein
MEIRALAFVGPGATDRVATAMATLREEKFIPVVADILPFGEDACTVFRSYLTVCQIAVFWNEVPHWAVDILAEQQIPFKVLS